MFSVPYCVYRSLFQDKELVGTVYSSLFSHNRSQSLYQSLDQVCSLLSTSDSFLDRRYAIYVVVSSRRRSFLQERFEGAIRFWIICRSGTIADLESLKREGYLRARDSLQLVLMSILVVFIRFACLASALWRET
jgi:hypothetical protein